jgi:hypothetical protein
MRRDVHRKAGVATGKYKASMYDVAGFGPEMEVSKQLYKQDLDKMNQTFAELGEGLVLAGNIRERMKSSADLERGMENLGKEEWRKEREKLAKKYAHDPSGTDYDPDKTWDKLSMKEKAGYMPIQTYGKGSFWEKAAVFGGGAEPLYEFGGKEYSKSKLETLIAGKEYDTLWEERTKKYKDE